MSDIKTEPTLRDLARASWFVATRGGHADDAEALAWLIAGERAQEREACAKAAEHTPVGDRHPAIVRNEIVDKIRNLQADRDATALAGTVQPIETTGEDNG